MFKSSFAKYLTAFIIIILVSFLMLSSIVTSLVRSHVTADKEEKLKMSCSIISTHFVDKNITDIHQYIHTDSASSILALIPIINMDYDFRVIITDEVGKVILSTINQDKEPQFYGDLGSIDVEKAFDEVEDQSGGRFLVHKGDIGGLVSESSLTYGKRILINEQLHGYAFTVVSTEQEDRLIRVMRNTVINSSIWVMLAAVIAAYFITEKIVNPLRLMTRAAKKFGKGDFSERVPVVGKDEVAELARSFNNMADSLDSLEKMRFSFLANVSHDLRTPMTTISGFIDGINSGAIPPEQQSHYLGVISAEVHRLSRLVSQLLDISRLESGDRKFNYEDFDIAEVARLVIISFEQQLEDKELDVEFDAERDEMPVFADKDAVYQVIYNLCHNAIKFSNVRGTFRIRITRTQDKTVRFSVYDDGQIISEDDAAHIFDRFYKSDKSRGLDKSGVGLGLYICKTIIDAHGGKIGLIVHDEGCEFWFELKEGSYSNKHR